MKKGKIVSKPKFNPGDIVVFKQITKNKYGSGHEILKNKKLVIYRAELYFNKYYYIFVGYSNPDALWSSTDRGIPIIWEEDLRKACKLNRGCRKNEMA